MAKSSPCIGECRLVASRFCSGCLRTKHEIMTWKDLSMEKAAEKTAQVQETQVTHHCPECSGPAYCAMEAGKSSSACWCFHLDPIDSDDLPIDQGKCMCRNCLKEYAVENA